MNNFNENSKPKSLDRPETITITVETKGGNIYEIKFIPVPDAEAGHITIRRHIATRYRPKATQELFGSSTPPHFPPGGGCEPVSERQVGVLASKNNTHTVVLYHPNNFVPIGTLSSFSPFVRQCIESVLSTLRY